MNENVLNTVPTGSHSMPVCTVCDRCRFLGARRMQRSIEMRDKLADKVVERRVQDLLNPDLKWDSKPVTILGQLGLAG